MGVNFAAANHPGISSFIVPQLTLVASAYDNGSSAYTADIVITLMRCCTRISSCRQKACEEALLICQESLKRATARIEQQKIQLPLSRVAELR